MTRKQKLKKFHDAIVRVDVLADELGMVNTRGAAEIRGVTPSAITQLIASGSLEAIYLFGSPYMLREDIIGYQKQKPGPKASSEE